jgi:hypothetical protein
VDRLVEELSDHAADLCAADPSLEAQQDVEARLGTPDQLAAVAKAEFQRRTFAGRHPIWMFIVAPIVAVIGTFLANGLLVIAALLLVEKLMGDSFLEHERNTTAFAIDLGILQFLNCCIRFVPFALSAWFFVRLGRRSGRRAWSMAACGIVAATALFLLAVVNPGTAKGDGTWVILPTWRIGFEQIIQAAVPLAFGMWMLWRSSLSRSNSFAE